MVSIFKKNAPRWLIFLFDITVAIFALILAYLLRFNFKIPESEYQFFPLAFSAVFTVRILYNFLFKTYAGIIRYTSIEDAYRIFIGTVSGSLTLVGINILNFFLGTEQFIVPFSVIVIEFLATTFLLIAFRVGVKVLYFELKNPSKSRTNVIIYGAGEAGIITKNSIDRDVGSKLKVAVFVDDDKKKIGKKLEGVKIEDSKNLKTLIEEYSPSHLVISSKKIRSEHKNQTIEICLAANVNILNVPPVKKWINGELSFNQIRKIDVEDLLERPTIQMDQKALNKSLKDKTVLVTGAAGSIGSEIVRQLTNFSTSKIVLLDVAESALYELDFELKNNLTKANYEIVIGDVRNEARMRNVFNTFKPSVVYHAAAYKHVPLMEDNPTESINTNVFGTKTVADLSSEFNVEKMVFVSTDKAVNPTNVMGASKRVAEMYVQALNAETKTKYITTRFGNVLGSNGSVIPLFKKQIAKGGPVYVTDPEITRYFMTIPEACQLVLQAGTLGDGGEVFVFDMGESVKIVDLAKKMIKLSGLELGKDIQISFTGLRPGEKLYEELLSDRETTLSTPHPKIKIAKVEEVSFGKVSEDISHLISQLSNQNNSEVVSTIKEIVKEFKSNNSEFEVLDNIKKSNDG